MLSHKTLVKICGIKDIDIARHCIEQGADMIGLVFCDASKRNITLSIAIEIAAQTQQKNCQPVAVFVDTDARYMQEICHTTKIAIVQLHGAIAKDQHRLLPEAIRRIYAVSVGAEGGISQTDIDNIAMLDPQRDFLLFDSVTPGSGVTFAWDKFSPQFALPWILAGGLNVENATSAINLLQPNGVDVSSGVENHKGEKDKEMITKFIATVKGRKVL